MAKMQRAYFAGVIAGGLTMITIQLVRVFTTDALVMIAMCIGLGAVQGLVGRQVSQ